MVEKRSFGFSKKKQEIFFKLIRNKMWGIVLQTALHNTLTEHKIFQIPQKFAKIKLNSKNLLTRSREKGDQGPSTYH